MVVVCGIDGSARSREASRAAAAIAKREKVPLTLVYVQEALMLGSEALVGAPVALANTAHLDADRERMDAELDRESKRLAAAFRIEVRHVIRTGLPDHELVRVAEEQDAELLVVASLGRRSGTMWRLGSVADRLSQSCPLSLLVVRDPGPFERWALEGGDIAVALAMGAGRTTFAAVEAARRLIKMGQCVLTEVHVYDPIEEARRRGLKDSEDSGVRGGIEKSLAREVPERYGRDPQANGVRFVALPGRGQVAETLAEFVDQERFDLVVMGTHRRGAVRRHFTGSVSYGVLPMVERNVLVVPPKAGAPELRRTRKVQNVLVATDLGETGNGAVDFALALVPDGGKLMLLHVDVPQELPSGFIMGYHPSARPTQGERRMKRALVEGELEQLSHRVAGRAFETRVEVVESSDVTKAILEAAERFEADVLCLGTHHYGRLASALIGSVARRVSRLSTRPVLLVPSE